MKKLSLMLCITFFITTAAAPVRALATSWKTLAEGDSGHEVYALKLLLRSWNVDPGEINITFDKKTHEALSSFQGKNGLISDGITNPETWEKLIAIVTCEEPPEGMEEVIRAVQYLLRNKYGFSSLETNGEFGLSTKAAVLLFQYNYNLGTNGTNGMDGTVGVKTWSYLIEESQKAGQDCWVIFVELDKDRNVVGTLSVFDNVGNKCLEMPCLGQSVTMNTDWRNIFANTPLGCFRANLSSYWRDISEYGNYLPIELNDADVKAVTNGRERILIHSGTSRYKVKVDPNLPHRYKGNRARTIAGLDQTHGCIRISGEHHASLYNLLSAYQEGVVCINEPLSTTEGGAVDRVAEDVPTFLDKISSLFKKG